MTEIKNAYKTKVLLISLFLFVSVDQLTKWIAKTYIEKTKISSYLGDLFRLQYTENTGAFLSMGASLPDSYRFWIFTIAVSLLIIAVIYLLYKDNSSKFSIIGFAFIVAGGIGNQIDRILYGRVIDFMNIGYKWFRTGIFNVADLAIVFGITFVFFATLKNKKSK